MTQRLRSIVVAAFLLLCILLGGSSQNAWTNLALQVLGIAVIAWAALAPEPAEKSRNVAFAYALLAFGALVLLIQLIPLPKSIWTELPGRSQLALAHALANQRDAALTVSLAPYRSMLTLFAAIPALALFVAATMLRPSPRWLAAAIVGGMTISIALGALQVAGGPDSWAYLYPITNLRAVGVFANANHMGTLLLVAVPFGTALLVSWKTGSGGSTQARWVMGIAGLALVGVGIALNGSRAALSLALPVLAASAALFPAALRWRRVALPIAAIALAGGIALLATGPIGTSLAGADTGPTSRQVIWSTTGEAIEDTFPVGSGLGTFEQVYRQYEDEAAVTRSYVNHAHNDYLELVLELGAGGVLLILLFLGWWVVAAVRIWRSVLSSPFERAATIASATILAHSFVDYPLRTAAIAAIFGFASALMTQPLRSTQPAGAGERRAPRHVKLG